MNQVLESDPACKQRNLKLKTYQVIPMTPRWGLRCVHAIFTLSFALITLCMFIRIEHYISKVNKNNVVLAYFRVGFIEWMNNTIPLKDFLYSNLTEQENKFIQSK
jgi:DNA-dependent protein kinase catalytic subunit